MNALAKKALALGFPAVAGASAGAAGAVALQTAREHEAIAVLSVDTITPRFLVKTDTVLRVVGSQIPVARCGTSNISLRTGQRSTQGSADTVDVTVPCAAPDTAPVTPPADSAHGAASDEPVYRAAPGDSVIMRDNMDGYTSAIAMGVVVRPSKPMLVPLPSPVGSGYAVDTNGTTVVTGRGDTGHALRMKFAGTYQSSATYSAMYGIAMPDMSTQVWTYWARANMPGLTKPDPGMAVKWFMAWHRRTSNTRIQWHLHNHLPWKSGSYLTYWGVYDQAETESQGYQPVGPRFMDVLDNAWHRYTYTFRPNSAAGARDGFARMWVDGVKVVDVSRATIGVTPPGGEKVWCNADDVDNLAVNDGIVQLMWGSVQTQVTPPWTLDIDDFLWWITP